MVTDQPTHTKKQTNLTDDKDNIIQFPKKKAAPLKAKTADEVLLEVSKSLKFIEDTVRDLAEAHEDTRSRALYNNQLIKWILAILVKCRIINLVDCPKITPD